MRRIVLLLLAIVGLVATPAVGQRRVPDWRNTIVQIPTGAYQIGNPAAKVKLVEYVSYTCPHCAHFLAESKPVLKDAMVRNGSVQVEIRHAVLNGVDMAAVLLARCAGPRGFVSATDAMFATQSDWAQRGMEYQGEDGARLAALPPLARAKALAQGAGLDVLMRRLGMTQAAVNGCFATPRDMNRVTAMTRAALQKIKGTPSFEINGVIVDGPGSWENLEPKLRAAGAR
jgi:protein-disulfide isomerase